MYRKPGVNVKKEHRIQTETALRVLQASRDRGVEWICSRIGIDGRPAGSDRLNSYYRIPWSLALAGKRDSASAVLGWIVRHALDEQGDLRAGAAREPFLSAMASYPLSQIAIGAWHLEQYDVAKKVMGFVQANLVDHKTGGAFSERPELRRTGRTDLLSTAQLGIAALTIGDEALADACYRWLAELYRSQPDLPWRLFPCRVGTALLTLPDAAHKEWDVVTDFHRPFQQFYNPGIAAAFLGRYGASKNDADALALARSYLDLTVCGAALQFDYKVNSQACKFGWGAAVLLDVDASDAYAQHALRMATWFVDSQYEDGHWAPSGFLVPNPDDADNLPKTAEHVLHVVTLTAALSKYAALCASAANAARAAGPPPGEMPSNVNRV